MLQVRISTGIEFDDVRQIVGFDWLIAELFARFVDAEVVRDGRFVELGRREKRRETDPPVDQIEQKVDSQDQQRHEPHGQLSGRKRTAEMFDQRTEVLQVVDGLTIGNEVSRSTDGTVSFSDLQSGFDVSLDHVLQTYKVHQAAVFVVVIESDQILLNGTHHTWQVTLLTGADHSSQSQGAGF